MNIRVAINIILVFGGGSVASWALLNWMNPGPAPAAAQSAPQDGSFFIIAGLIGLVLFIIGLASQMMIKEKKD